MCIMSYQLRNFPMLGWIIYYSDYQVTQCKSQKQINIQLKYHNKITYIGIKNG